MLLTLVILDMHPRQFMRPPHCMTGRFSWHSWLQCLQHRIRQTGNGLWQKFGDSYALETAVPARKPKPHSGDNLRIGFCHDLLSMPWPCFVTQLWSKTGHPIVGNEKMLALLVEFQRVCHSRAVLFGLSCASAACLHRGECKSEEKDSSLFVLVDFVNWALARIIFTFPLSSTQFYTEAGVRGLDMETRTLM